MRKRRENSQIIKIMNEIVNTTIDLSEIKKRT
jgi:hypothetical protein